MTVINFDSETMTSSLQDVVKASIDYYSQFANNFTDDILKAFESFNLYEEQLGNTEVEQSK